jgi:hypothetical protein
LDTSERLPPIEPAGTADASQADDIRGSSRFDVGLLIQDQLFTQKEILGCKSGAVAQIEPEEAHAIAQKRQQHADEGLEGRKSVRESCHKLTQVATY